MGRAVQVIVAEPAVRESGRVGTPDEDGARLAKIRNHRAVFFCDDVAEFDDAVGGGVAALVDIDLGGDGNAVQRSEPCAGLDGGVGLVPRSQRLLSEDFDNGVQRRIDRCDAFETGLDGLPARDLSRSNRTRKVRRTNAIDRISFHCFSPARER